VILNNSEEHAREAMADLEQYGDTSCIIWQQCNLGSLQQTDEVAKKLRTEEQRVDGIGLHAGPSEGR
jgi:WW domain-containing oxidoreductase